MTERYDKFVIHEIIESWLMCSVNSKLYVLWGPVVIKA